MSFIQSLLAAFKAGSDRVPLARGAASPWFFAESGRRAPYEYNSAVRRAYLENPVAQRAVRLVAEGIAGAPLQPADVKLMALVSATSAGQSLLETVASHLLLHGNAWVQVLKDAAGRPVELFALRPERMTVVAGEDGWPSACTYAVAGRQVTIPLLGEDASPNLGRGEGDPAGAPVLLGGITLRPLAPVHPRRRMLEDGTLRLEWTRRARGGWQWQDGIDVPLVEQSEGYLVTLGPIETPVAMWNADRPELEIGPVLLGELTAAAPGEWFRVRQRGTHALSPPLPICSLP